MNMGLQYRVEFYSAMKRNIFICDYMDGIGDYYVMWNRLSRERQMSHDATPMWSLEVDGMSVGCGMVVARSWREYGIVWEGEGTVVTFTW